MTVAAQQPLIRLRPEGAISERDQFEAARQSETSVDTHRSAKPRRNTDFGSLANQFLTSPRNRRNYT